VRRPWNAVPYLEYTALWLKCAALWLESAALWLKCTALLPVCTLSSHPPLPSSSASSDVDRSLTPPRVMESLPDRLLGQRIRTLSRLLFLSGPGDSLVYASDPAGSLVMRFYVFDYFVSLTDVSRRCFWLVADRGHRAKSLSAGLHHAA
jgi:hypothetical protein